MSVLTVFALAAVVVVEEDGSTRSDASILVPRSTSVVLDGRLDETEWRGSAIVRRPDGDLLLRHDGKYLYVGVRTARRGLPTLFVTRGNSVRVIEAPYALGKAIPGKKGTTLRRHAEIRIALDQLDRRDPRISVAFSVDEGDRGDEITSASPGRRDATWTRLRLAPAPRLG